MNPQDPTQRMQKILDKLLDWSADYLGKKR
jgi:hypothetical protein